MSNDFVNVLLLKTNLAGMIDVTFSSSRFLSMEEPASRRYTSARSR